MAGFSAKPVMQSMGDFARRGRPALWVGWGLLTVVAAGTALAEPALTVAMSIAPQRCLVERIGGPVVRSLVVVAPGQSPTTYEPSARQLTEVVHADLYFSIGVPFERHWLPRLRALAPELLILDQGEGVQRRQMEADHHHEPAGPHGEGEALDPHIWLAPQLLRQQADRVLAALEARHPAAAAGLRQHGACRIARDDARL